MRKPAEEQPPGGPLHGLKVIEFTHMVMGPTVGAILAGLGADVTKVEPIGGDKTRRLKGSGAGYFAMFNRNKRSLQIDLKNPEGLAIAKQLMHGADIVVENFRQGTMANLGLDFDSVHQDNPKLIYCSLKGFLSGPYEKRVALDEVTQMMGGLAYMTGPPGQPLRAGSSVIDITGGMFGVIGILAAVEERHRTGQGRHVTSALFETTAYLVGQHMAQEVVSGQAPPPMSVRQSAWAVYDIFSLNTGEQLFVGIVSDQLWQRFCKEFERPDWGGDMELRTNAQRVAARERLLPEIRSMFEVMTMDQLCQRLERAGLPFAPINSPSNLFDDPHLNASGGLDETVLVDGDQAGLSAKLPTLPIQFNHSRVGTSGQLPAAGEHNAHILKELGFSEAECQRLLMAGIIAAND